MLNWFTRMLGFGDKLPQVHELATEATLPTTEKRSFGLNAPFSFLPVSPSGVTVTNETALSLPPIFAGIKYISEGIAMLDRHVLGKDGQTLGDHALVPFFNGRPNEQYSWFDMLSALLTNAVFGNGYLLIYRDEITMRPIGLEHIPSEMCWPDYSQSNSLYYNISGSVNGRIINVHAHCSDVIHIKGLTLNGIEGQQISLVHRATIGAGLAATRYSESLFANQARPSLAIQYAEALDKDQRIALEDNIMARHSGPFNIGRPLILDDGMELKYVQWSPNELALSDFRNLNTREVCQLLKIPPDMMALDGKGTYGATKMRSQDFLLHCLRPWIEKIQEEFNAKLFYNKEFLSRNSYFEFDTSMYLELDKEAEAKIKHENAQRLAALVAGTVMTPNEARAEMGLPLVKNGDELFGNINMLPLKDLVEVALAKYLSKAGEVARAEKDKTETESTKKIDNGQLN